MLKQWKKTKCERVRSCQTWELLGSVFNLLLSPLFLPSQWGPRGQRHWGLTCSEEPLSLSPSKGGGVPGNALISPTQYGDHLWSFYIPFECCKLLPGLCCYLHPWTSLDEFLTFSKPQFFHLYGGDGLTDESHCCHFEYPLYGKRGVRVSFMCILI